MKIRKLYKLLVDCESVLKKSVKNPKKHEELFERISHTKKKLLKINKIHIEDDERKRKFTEDS